MLLFRSPSSRSMSLGLAVLRIAVGAVFINHGYAKLFKFGFAGVTGAFTQMGVPLPGIMGPFVGLLEFFGGIALVIGLLTRLFALGFAPEYGRIMSGAVNVVTREGASKYSGALEAVTDAPSGSWTSPNTAP